MKHLKPFELNEAINQNKRQIIALCKKFGIENYTINSDNSIDVDEYIYFDEGVITGGKLPVKFGKIKWDFNCEGNELTSLEGFPTWVGGSFYLFNNPEIKSLEGMPEFVGDSIGIWDNGLTSLKGCPEKATGEFNCEGNKLKDLEGGPKWIKGDYHCGDNPLTSLKGAPQKIVPDGALSKFTFMVEQDISEESDDDFGFIVANKSSGFPKDEITGWGPEAWIKFLGTDKSRYAKELVVSLLTDSNLDSYFIKNPIDIHLLDPFPQMKEGVLRRTGIKDMSRLGRNLKTGLI